MCDRNTAVDEERRKTGQGEQPIEDSTAAWGQVDECQTSEEKLKHGDDNWTTLFVDVCESFGTHS